MASVLGKLGIESAMVVHGLDGFDEISLIGETHLARLANGTVKEEFVTPSSFGLEKRSFDEVSSHDCDIDDHATTALRILQCSPAKEKEMAVRDMVLANASAGLVVSGKASTFMEGIDLAKVSLESGRAFQKLNDLVRYSEGDKTRIDSLLFPAQRK